MIETLAIDTLNPKAAGALLEFINGAGSPEEISEKSREHEEYLKGVTTGISVAEKILALREKLGSFSKLEELLDVPYFTEEKILTLVGVFYVELNIWIPGPRDLPGDDINIILPPPPPTGGPKVSTPGKLAKLTVHASGKGRPNFLRAYLPQAPKGVLFKGVHPARVPQTWTVTFELEGNAISQTHELRLDFLDAGKFFLAGVEVQWNPVKTPALSVKV